MAEDKIIVDDEKVAGVELSKEEKKPEMLYCL